MTPDRPLPPAGAILVGRPNVGKSTLFNRLVGRPAAIVSPEAGTTRDLNRGQVDWAGKRFWLTDSGGWLKRTASDLDRMTLKQLESALAQARLALLVIDGQVGLTPEDRRLAQFIRRLKLPCVLVVNKMDSGAKRAQGEGISLGFADTVMVSAKNGSGTGDLLDVVLKHLDSHAAVEPQLSLVLLGQTNVGKSSLFNKLLGYERSIVHATPHTTRDRQHEYVHEGRLVVELIDTAGVRRRLKGAPKLEQQSAAQSLETLTTADVVCVVIDASLKRAFQDQRIGDLVAESGRACVVALNKSDLVPFDQRKRLVREVDRWFPMLSWAPKVWVSAKTGEGLTELMAATRGAAHAWRKQLTPQELKDVRRLLERSSTTRTLPFTDFQQTGTMPPSFVAPMKTKENIPVALRGFLEQALRKRYGFAGSPVRVRLQGQRKK